MPNAPLTIIAMTTAAPGQESKLRALQEILVAETLNEPGCQRYELYQSLENGRILVFVETWATEEHWRAHMNSSSIQQFQARGGPNLIQDFTLHRLAQVA